jgi:hypothetical protein
MKVSKIFQAALVGAAALWMSTGGAFAVCALPLGGFAIFQCADLAYFPPSPEPVTFDAAGRVSSGVTTVFWQLGFGNALINSGLGTGGNGFRVGAGFEGIDNGVSVTDIGEGNAITSRTDFPPGALCLGNNNWQNTGIDACADNDRSALVPLSDDDIINPAYDVYYTRNGIPGYTSYTWYQDYPIAVLAKTTNGKWFAIAAVSNMDRGNNGDLTGPCNTTVPGTNPAACDPRPGHYEFKNVTNGGTNAITAMPNVIPWQMTPRPRAFCVAGCTGVVTRTINFSWTPVKWYHDATVRPSTNPAMAPTDATRAAGVGVVDILSKLNATNNWMGLARYNLQSATVSPANLDPNGNVAHSTLVFANVAGHTDIPQPAPLGPDGNPTATSVDRSSVSVPPDTCWRVQALFGKKPETNTLNAITCRLGKCGDRGYTAESLNPMTITCVGGSLLSEEIGGASANRRQGGITVNWSSTSEISVVKYNLYAKNTKGGETLVQEVSCTECTTGGGGAYSVRVPSSSAKGAKSIIIEMVTGSGSKRVEVPIL